MKVNIVIKGIHFPGAEDGTEASRAIRFKVGAPAAPPLSWRVCSPLVRRYRRAII